MKSHTTRFFWKLYEALPEQVRRQAKRLIGDFSKTQLVRAYNSNKYTQSSPFIPFASIEIIVPSA